MTLDRNSFWFDPGSPIPGHNHTVNYIQWLRVPLRAETGQSSTAHHQETSPVARNSTLVKRRDAETFSEKKVATKA